MAWTPCETPLVKGGGGGNAEVDEDDEVLDEKVVDDEDVEALEPDELRPDPPVVASISFFVHCHAYISITSRKENKIQIIN